MTREIVELLKQLVKLFEMGRGHNHFYLVEGTGVHFAAGAGGTYIYAIKAVNGDAVLDASGTVPTNPDFLISTDITIKEGDILSGNWSKVQLVSGSALVWAAR